MRALVAELPFGDSVGPVGPLLGRGEGLLRTAGAVGALVHDAPLPIGVALGKLRRPEGTGVQTVTAPDTDVLAPEHQPVFRLVERVYRTDSLTGRCAAMHAGYGHVCFARLTFLDRGHSNPLNPFGDVVLILARHLASTAFNAPASINEEL
jgi:hypothetical protein